MQQLEIKFFWPLTEQIPLDLDYTGCEKPKLALNSIPLNGNAMWGTVSTAVGTTVISTEFQLDSDKTTFAMATEPSFTKRMLLNILGIKWKVR